MKPRCPRCECTDLEACDVLCEASDRSDSFKASHECKQCHTRFRYTPPAEPFNPIRLSRIAT